MRGDRVNNFDLGVIKNTRVAEGKNIQFKAEILNAFNHPQFPLPTSNATNPANADFGWVGGGSTSSNQANYPRRIQLSAKFIF